MTSIGNLNRPQNKLEPIEGLIESIGDVKTVNLKNGSQAQVVNAILADGTGKITLVLWDAQIKMVKPGSRIRVENGYITQFRGQSSLNVGKYGKLSVIEF